MIIKELDFNAFSKLLLDKEVLMGGIGFNSTGTVDVLLNLQYNWRLIRSTRGGVGIWYCEESESVWHYLGELEVCEFTEITVC
jgi:hypothetical protein